MLVYTAKRLSALPLVVLGISIVVFVAMRAIPGDPALVLTGLEASELQIQEVRARLGLDRPVYVQYGYWLARVLRGDLGRSVVTGHPVSSLLGYRYLNTLQLTITALGIATLLGIAAGVVAALRPNTVLDYGTMIGALIGVSVPSFWLGLLLILAFSVQLGWLPVGGKGTLLHLILPAITLGAFSIGLLARMTRSSMLEVLGEEYVLVARAKGLREKSVVLKHALRNALLPITTVIGLQVGYGMAGAVVTEQVFAWPGIGRLLVDSIFRRDYAVVQGSVLLIATTFVTVNLIVDLLYGVIDPRIRYV